MTDIYSNATIYVPLRLKGKSGCFYVQTTSVSPLGELMTFLTRQ